MDSASYSQASLQDSPATATQRNYVFGNIYVCTVEACGFASTTKAQWTAHEEVHGIVWSCANCTYSGKHWETVRCHFALSRNNFDCAPNVDYVNLSIMLGKEVRAIVEKKIGDTASNEEVVSYFMAHASELRPEIDAIHSGRKLGALVPDQTAQAGAKRVAERLTDTDEASGKRVTKKRCALESSDEDAIPDVLNGQDEMTLATYRQFKAAEIKMHLLSNIPRPSTVLPDLTFTKSTAAHRLQERRHYKDQIHVAQEGLKTIKEAKTLATTLLEWSKGKHNEYQTRFRDNHKLLQKAYAKENRLSRARAHSAEKRATKQMDERVKKELVETHPANDNLLTDKNEDIGSELGAFAAYGVAADAVAANIANGVTADAVAADAVATDAVSQES